MSASQAPIDDFHASQEAPEDESNPVEATGAGRGSVLDRLQFISEGVWRSSHPFPEHHGHLTESLQIKTVLYV